MSLFLSTVQLIADNFCWSHQQFRQSGLALCKICRTPIALKILDIYQSIF